MKFTGLLLKESLEDLGVLDLVEIISEEKWDIKNAADFQPKVWTAIRFEGDLDKVEEIAEKMGKAMKSRWYLNIGTDDEEFVVFQNKVFRYKKGDEEGRKRAQEHGRSFGIPEEQLDW